MFLISVFIFSSPVNLVPGSGYWYYCASPDKTGRKYNFINNM